MSDMSSSSSTVISIGLTDQNTVTGNLKQQQEMASDRKLLREHSNVCYTSIFCTDIFDVDDMFIKVIGSLMEKN